MFSVRRCELLICLAALAISVVPPRSAPAQNTTAQQPVARLSHLSGSVQIQQEDMTEPPFDAALNMSIVQGERILTSENGEAEVEFADGSVLRITPNSAASVDRLTESAGATEMQLGNGLFYLELRSSDRASYVVYAVDETLAPEENASFRVRVNNGQVETGVLRGSISVTRQSSYTADLKSGESMRSDPKNDRRYLLSDTIPEESWDSWNERLSQEALDEEAARTPVRDSYATDQGYGWADLDASGSWYDVPGEGQIWQPSGLDTSFDPYGYGNWVYGSGGYSWASAYSWGWLPYRCGSWGYYNSFGWGWIPTSGCRNFGYGGGGGNGFFPVRHPPGGWSPPHRPIDRQPDGVRIRRHPTLPIRLLPTDQVAGRSQQTLAGGTVRVGNVIATPIRRVGHVETPHGQSAVGSALLRDFPVRSGTREPNLGRVVDLPAVIPGRPAEWRGVTPASGPATGRVQSAVVQGAGRPAEGFTGNGPSGNPAITSGTSAGSRVGASGASSGRGLKPTTPPLNANGSPPLNADGPPPLDANGPPPLNADGSPALDATGSPALDANGFVVRNRLPGRTNRVGVTPTTTLTGGSTGQAGGVPSTGRPSAIMPVIPRAIAPAPTPLPRIAPVSPVLRSTPAPAPVIHTVPTAPAPAPVVPARPR